MEESCRVEERRRGISSMEETVALDLTREVVACLSGGFIQETASSFPPAVLSSGKNRLLTTNLLDSTSQTQLTLTQYYFLLVFFWVKFA